jgi:hypothetical protein
LFAVCCLLSAFAALKRANADTAAFGLCDPAAGLWSTALPTHYCSAKCPHPPPATPGSTQSPRKPPAAHPHDRLREASGGCLAALGC